MDERKICPMCGDIYKITLTSSQAERYNEYLRHGGYIQDAMSDLNKCEREFLKTGYCPQCQRMIFGNGSTKKIKQVFEEDYEYDED